MTLTDDLLKNNEASAASFSMGDSRCPRPRRLPWWRAWTPGSTWGAPARKDKIRGFVYEVETGKLREVG